MSRVLPVKSLSLFTLVMLITGAIDSIRNLPATALFGSQLVFFLIFGAVMFLLPAGLVSAELSSSFPEAPGVYGWSRQMLGPRWAFLTIWLQWINTLVWYPTILSFIAGTIAVFVAPALASNKLYLVSIILGVFWFQTLLNLRGFRTSARFASSCAVVGMIIPMIGLIFLAGDWVLHGNPLQIHLTLSSMLPHIHQANSWISLTAIMTSFLGIELATAHVQFVKDPQRTFPKAILISVAVIVLTMLLGSLAIAIVLPHDQINLVEGVMLAFKHFFEFYHMTWCLPIMTVMILFGSLGGMTNWIISPARGLLLASEDNFLPQYWRKTNAADVPYRILIAQAVLVSILCLVFLMMPSVNSSYWLLSDLSTELYIIMYLVVFAALIVSRFKYPEQVRPFCIPGGTPGMMLTTGMGLVACVLTLCIGFFPPEGLALPESVPYELIFLAGVVVLLLPVLFFFRHRARS